MTIEKKMVIGLDYDDTFTCDPLFWSQVIGLSKQRGHEFVCVTSRHIPPDPTCEPPLPASVPVVCAGSEWKLHAAAKAGYTVNVWIDDCPDMVRPSRILMFGGTG